MNTIRLFLFPTEWSATLVLFFRTPPYGQLPEPMGGFDPLGLLPIHLFMVCLASLTYARMDTHVRDWAKLIAVLATPVVVYAVPA